MKQRHDPNPPPVHAPTNFALPLANVSAFQHDRQVPSRFATNEPNPFDGLDGLERET